MLMVKIMVVSPAYLSSILKHNKSLSSIAEWSALMKEILPKYQINTPMRVAHFIAQCAHESGEFTRLVENMNYSADGLANTWKSRYATGKPAENGKQKPNELALFLSRKPESIANNVYAGRMGNRSEASGDGWKYRGRGLIMNTGADQYKRLSAALGENYIDYPERLERKRDALMAACWYWSSNKINEAADKNDIEAVTKKVNGGLIGLKDRKEYLARAIEGIY